jgi:hypothetical protein
LTIDVPAAPPSRRFVRWLLAGAFALSLLMMACVVCWFWLPVWAPATVIRHSPWMEPVVRAGTQWKGDHHDWSLYHERFRDWGPAAYPTLSRLLHDSGLRQSALGGYQLIAPYTAVATSLAEPRDWESVVVNVNTIHEDGRQWWVVRMNNVDLELPDDDLHQLATLAPKFERMRERSEKAPHPRMPGRQLAKLVIHLRCDRLVPYRVVDGLLRLALNGPRPDSALIASLYLIVRRDEDSTMDRAEEDLRLMLMPAGPDAWPIILSSAAAGDPSSALTITYGDGRSAVVTGMVDGKERRDAIAKALSHALPIKTSLSSISVRGSADCRWADVVTAVVAAAALCQEGATRNLSGIEEPLPIGRVTLALMPDGH